MALSTWFFRFRSYTPLPLLALTLLLGDASYASVATGFGVAVVGLLIRFWGARAAGPLIRVVDAPGGSELVTYGPFAYVRNPLYLGNILMYTGVAVMSGIWWIAVLGLAYFLFQYTLIVHGEEAYLQRTFGDQFVHYTARVHRFIPRLTPYRVAEVARNPLRPVPDTLRAERRTLQAFVIVLMMMLLQAIF
jgi:protein-S-isoprenylcysteine O-methyltransferase Ste14